MEIDVIHFAILLLCTLLSIFFPGAIVTLSQSRGLYAVFNRQIEPWFYARKTFRSKDCFSRDRHQTRIETFKIHEFERLLEMNGQELGLVWCRGSVETWSGSNSKFISDSSLPVSATPQFLEWLSAAAMQHEMPEWFRQITKWKFKVSGEFMSLTIYYDEPLDEGISRLLKPLFDPIWDMLSQYSN